MSNNPRYLISRNITRVHSDVLEQKDQRKDQVGIVYFIRNMRVIIVLYNDGPMYKTIN